MRADGWHPLLSAPFRYPLPVAQTYEARFRPTYFDKNVLYCSATASTASHELAFHFMRQRRHLQGFIATEQRLLFSLSIVARTIVDVRRRADVAKLTARDDYSASHAFIRAHPEAQVIAYPSCRDPKRGSNYAVFDLASLAKGIDDQQTLTAFYDQRKDEVYLRELSLTIRWKDVA